MELAKFNEKFPEDLEGYTIGKLRITSPDEVEGFVLIDQKGERRFILYIGNDCYIEPYW